MEEVHPPEVFPELTKLGYKVLRVKSAVANGLVGRGVIVLAVHKDGGPWATWYVGNAGPVAGHYFDIEKNAIEDFESRGYDPAYRWVER